MEKEYWGEPLWDKGFELWSELLAENNWMKWMEKKYGVDAREPRFLRWVIIRVVYFFLSAKPCRSSIGWGFWSLTSVGNCVVLFATFVVSLQHFPAFSCCTCTSCSSLNLLLFLWFISAILLCFLLCFRKKRKRENRSWKCDCRIGEGNIERKSGGDWWCDWRGFARRKIEKNRVEGRSGYLGFARFLGKLFRL